MVNCYLKLIESCTITTYVAMSYLLCDPDGIIGLFLIGLS